MNEPRLSWTRISPKAYKAMAGVGETLAESSLGHPLIELVQARVSQVNGCAFCVDMHARELRMQGETWQRINSLSTWRETGLYSARERAALGWGEAITRLADRHDGHDAAFDALKGCFSDQEIVELSWVIAQINAWNRMAVGMRAAVAEKAMA
jgi:AhpD family alkylhydroperoxidase